MGLGLPQQAKLADLHALSRFPEKRARFAERPEFRCMRKSKQNGGRVTADSPWEKRVNGIPGSVVAGSSFWSNIGAKALKLTGSGGHGDGGDGSSGDGGGDGGDGSSGGSHEPQIRSAVANEDKTDEDQTPSTHTSFLAAAAVTRVEGNDAVAKRSETNALKRLQHEAFADLMRVRERLDKLEVHTGLRTRAKDLPEAEKTRLNAEVCAGAAVLLLDDERSSRASRAAVEQSGLHTGMDVRFTFETPYRDADLMVTECSAGREGRALGGPLAITKVVYNAEVMYNKDRNVALHVRVAPVGARAGDVTEIINPLQGQTLTEFARAGPPMYQHCAGSALGAQLQGGTSGLVSVSQFLSGWGNAASSGPPLCLTTLAHAMFHPWESFVFSLSAVNRFWPSPPLPSFRGLHWSEMGPLVMTKTRDVQAPSNDASWATTPSPRGNGTQSVAVAGEIDVGANVTLAGWAQADRGELEKREIEWGVSLQKSVKEKVEWGLCVGSSKVDISLNEDNAFLGPGDGSGDGCDMQLHMEAFMKLSMGRGFTLQPGLVYLLNRQSQTPAFMLRSSWVL